jgi:hypothetical protein
MHSHNPQWLESICWPPQSKHKQREGYWSTRKKTYKNLIPRLNARVLSYSWKPVSFGNMVINLFLMSLKNFYDPLSLDTHKGMSMLQVKWRIDNVQSYANASSDTSQTQPRLSLTVYQALTCWVWRQPHPYTNELGSVSSHWRVYGNTHPLLESSREWQSSLDTPKGMR